MSETRIRKQELPLAGAAEIEELVRQFLACTLPYPHWTHRAHLALGLSLVRQYPAEEALSRVRAAIDRYNRSCGDPAGYNETITVLFMRKLTAEQASPASREDIAEELARLQGLCSVEWLYRYYSKALIWSAEAKAGWIEPDLAELDF